MPPAFHFENEAIALPQGAIARTHRHVLRWRDRPLLSISQGPFRPYIYPLYTPAGQQVLEESPADHPHHNGVWAAADHVDCQFELDDNRLESGTYGFFVNQVFQGRAPGTIELAEIAGDDIDDGRFRLRMRCDWRGPAEWGAPDGRLLVHEVRTIEIHAGTHAHVIDIHSEIAPGDWNLVIGPTRHAYFGIRVADSLKVTQGGGLLDADGNTAAQDISAGSAVWLDCWGPAPRDTSAGIAIMARESSPHSWFATDWGAVHLNPIARDSWTLNKGKQHRVSMRLAVHDGRPDKAKMDALQRSFVAVHKAELIR